MATQSTITGDTRKWKLLEEGFIQQWMNTASDDDDDNITEYSACRLLSKTKSLFHY